MPAPLPHPNSKHDIRLFNADVDFIKSVLEQGGGSVTFNEWVRTLVNRAANKRRRELGLAELT